MMIIPMMRLTMIGRCYSEGEEVLQAFCCRRNYAELQKDGETRNVPGTVFIFPVNCASV